MMRFKTDDYYVYGVLIPVFFLGFVLSKTLSFPDFKVSEDVNIVDIFAVIVGIFSIIATLFIAHEITSKLDKDKENFKIRTEILLKVLEKIVISLEVFELETYKNKKVESAYVILTMKQVYLSYKSFLDYLKIYSVVTTFDEDDMKKEIRNLRKLCTTIDNKEVKYSKDKYKYSKTAKYAIINQSKAIIAKIISTELEISNR